MKNQEEENDSMPSRELFPMDVVVSGIKHINYSFDPKNIKPWSTSIVEYDDNNQRKIQAASSSNIRMPDYINISDKEKLQKLLALEPQLIYDYYNHALSLAEKDQTIEVLLSRCALLVNLATNWEDFGIKLHTIFRRTDRNLADEVLAKILHEYVIEYYAEAVGNLARFGRDTPAYVTEENKNIWGRMLVYALYKGSSITKAYRPDAIKSNEEFIKIACEILVKNGLAHLVPDFKPSLSRVNGTTEDVGLFGGAKEMVWSAWSGMRGFIFGVDQTKHEEIKPQHGQDSRTAPEMLRDKAVKDDEDNTQLKQRKVKKTNTDL